MSGGLRYDSIKNLFERYYITLVEYVWHIVNCEEVARDVVQDVFVKILEREGILPADEKQLRSYLYSMVKNQALNYLRHQKTVQNHQKNSGLWSVTQEDTLDALIYAESIDRVHTAIETLPAACQNVCKLTYLEEKSNKEVADYNQISINTVKTQKRRAIDLLRKQLVPTMRSVRTFFWIFF